MRRNLSILVFAIQSTMLFGCVVALRSGRIPLGVRGEWEWLRITAPPNLFLLLIAVGSLAFYVAYVATALSRILKGKRAWGWLVGLLPMAVLVQVGLQEGAPLGYGLVKWAIALYSPGSSGYYTVAKQQIPDLPVFLANYPVWIKKQDAFHVGTHPPGLFVISWGLLRFMEANPAVAQGVVRLFPPSLEVGFRSVAPTQVVPVADQAALAVTGALILLACSATTLPLYAMARTRLSPAGSWVAASLWPVVPAAIMFQPTSDTGFPLLSTSALALALWSVRKPGLAAGVGAVLAVGTQLTLAFFPVGLIVAIVYLIEPGCSWWRRVELFVRTASGFLGLTLLLWAATDANPFVIWSVNAANHARFYVQDPRNYWAWVLVNPLELAISIGVPTVVLIAMGLKSGLKVAWATIAVLIVLTLSGKNLSEVARLWLPLMPPLLLFAGEAVERWSLRPIQLVGTISLLGLQTLILEATIQVVYPI